VEYTSSEVQKRANVAKRELIHWCETGAIRPVHDDRRRGGVRRFNQQNLIEAMICRELVQYGLQKWVFRALLDGLRIFKLWDHLQRGGEVPFLAFPPLRHLGLETVGVKALSREEVAVFIQKWPSAIIINLPKLIEEAGGL
jgi:DNA-binding transcriptional MerR regulator